MQQKNSIRNITKLYYRYGAIFLLLSFAAIQFILILRHKSPYLSDSYFYKHIYYEMKGDSFEEARVKILGVLDIESADNISKNFYQNEEAYKNTLSFFTKRPLYPLIAAFISTLGVSDYLSFLIPLLISYLSSIIISTYFFQKVLDFQLSVVATALVVSFYPLLDWSTYFLTDIIGLFFWLLQLLLIYLFLTKGKDRVLVLFLTTTIFSLSLREQSVLMVPLLLIMIVSTYLVKNFKSYRHKLSRLFIYTSSFVFIYFLLLSILNQRNLIDAIVYTKNEYGLLTNTYSLAEIINYQKDKIIEAHIGFAKDLVRHHWWFLFTILSILGIIKTLAINKKISLVGLILLSSAVSSYMAIFLYPVLSYRYFFPILVAMLYFSVKLFEDFSNTAEIKKNESN